MKFEQSTLVFALAPIFAYMSKTFTAPSTEGGTRALNNYIEDLLRYTKREYTPDEFNCILAMSQNACDVYQRFCRKHNIDLVGMVSFSQIPVLAAQLRDRLDYQELEDRTVSIALNYYTAHPYNNVSALVQDLFKLELDDSFNPDSSIWLNPSSARIPRYLVYLISRGAEKLLLTDGNKIHPKHQLLLNCYGFTVESVLGRSDIAGYEVGEIQTCKGRITFG